MVSVWSECGQSGRKGSVRVRVEDVMACRLGLGLKLGFGSVVWLGWYTAVYVWLWMYGSDLSAVELIVLPRHVYE